MRIDGTDGNEYSDPEGGNSFNSVTVHTRLVFAK